MKKLKLHAGAGVTIRRRPAVIVRVADLDSYLVRYDNDDLQFVSRIDIDDPDTIEKPRRSIDDWSERDIEEASRWYEALKPVLENQIPHGEVSAFLTVVAKSLGKNRSTIYRRLANYDGTMMSLAPKGGQGGRGRSRMSNEREALLDAIIRKRYLNRDQYKPKYVYDEYVVVEFASAGFRPPVLSTFYDRIHALDPIETIAARQGARAAREARKQMKGDHPFGEAPLSSVQMDYWDYDLEIVDSVERLPIGRPRLAMVIDTFSFMPIGYYLSLDPTGASSAGLAVFHAISRKEKWLKGLGVEMDWPVWGMPKSILVDNAKEFRGSMLRQFARESEGEIVNRRVRRPQDGPHIERYFGKLAYNVKHLPGATGSNVTEKAALRDPRKTASMTLEDLERYLLSVIKEHINTRHSGLGMTPLQKWRSYFFEDGRQINRLPDEVEDLDFWRKELLPKTTRTLQTYGIQWDLIHYDSDALVALRHRHYRTPEKTFTIRRDPRNISEIYVWDPDNKVYLTVRYRSLVAVPMSIWDHRAAKRHLEEKGIRHIGETEIFDAHKERLARQDLVAQSKKDTVKARRLREQKRRHETARTREQAVIAGSRKLSPLPKPPLTQSVAASVEPADGHDSSADTFDDLDI